MRGFGAVFVAGMLALAGCQSTDPVGEGATREGVWSSYAVPEEEPVAVQQAPKARYASVPVDGPYIALTFDDGPSARLTPALLDILKQHQIRATFFVVGQRVAAHPEILQRIADDGHEIGNHTWDHGALDRMNLAVVRGQLEKTNNVIRAVVGQTPTLMRPPYGKTNAHLNQWIFDNLGLTVIMWSVDSNDWQHRDADRVRREIVSATRPGAIILSHDIQPSTVAAMPATLETLLARGYQFVTVSELIELETPGGF